MRLASLFVVGSSSLVILYLFCLFDSCLSSLETSTSLAFSHQAAPGSFPTVGGQAILRSTASWPVLLSPSIVLGSGASGPTWSHGPRYHTLCPLTKEAVPSHPSCSAGSAPRIHHLPTSSLPREPAFIFNPLCVRLRVSLARAVCSRSLYSRHDFVVMAHFDVFPSQ